MSRNGKHPVVTQCEETASELVEEPAAINVPKRSSPQQHLTPVQEFFVGRSVLVTGATGFMGMVLVEKLLFICPGIHAVYIIIRPKKGRSIEERVERMAKETVFSRLGKDHWRRVVPVAGDISQPGLGLSKEDLTRLCEDVSIVFHLAATVRFNEPLRVATCINVKGTRELLLLCRKMTKLQVVVHTSTMYSQCIRFRVEERHYDAPISAAKLISLCDSLQPGEQHDQELARRLLGDYPNTYLFTKAVAETMVNNEFEDLPICIVRPSSVSATKSEPLPGWTNNISGPIGIGMGKATGVLHTVYCDNNAIANMVPCDMSINLILVAAWDLVFNRYTSGKGKPVYNHVSSRDSPLTFRDFNRISMQHVHKIPTIRAIWYPSTILTNNRMVYLFLRTLLHLVPAIIFDTCRFLIGQKPMLMQLYRKIHLGIDLYIPFSTRFWDFDNTQAKALWSRLSNNDRQLLPFDMRNFDWDEYLYHNVRGARIYLLKDDFSTVPAAKIRWKRLMWLHRVFKTLFFLLLTLVCWQLIN